MNIALVFFSGTGVTKAYAQVIHKQLEELDCKVSLKDVTPYAARQKPLQVANHDAFIFGFPVYA